MKLGAYAPTKLLAALAIAALFLSSTGLTQFVQVAYAAPVKIFTASISPSSIDAGEVDKAFTFTIGNDASSDADIKSASIAVPTGFSVTNVGVDDSEFEVMYNSVNGQIETSLKPGSGSAGVTPGSSIKVTADVTNTSGSGSIDWEVCAYKNNSFNPGGGAQFDIKGGVGCGSVSINVKAPEADLSITKVADNESPDENGEVTYKITVANSGPNTATGIVVSDTIPSDTTFVSADPAGSGSGTMTWDVPDLDNGDEYFIEVTVKVNEGTGGSVITNTALVSSDYDSNVSNDSVDEDITVNVPLCTDDAAKNTGEPLPCVYPEALITLLKTFAPVDHDPLYTADDFTFYLEGVEVELGVATTVAPDTYTITEVGPTSAFDLTIECKDGGTLDGADLTVADSDDVTCTLTNTYKTNPPSVGSIAGTKFEGDTATGLSGWRIFIDEDGDRIWDDGVEKNAVTNGDGDYVIEGIPAGNIVVCEVQQPGWTQIYPDTEKGCQEVTVVADQRTNDVDFRNTEDAVIPSCSFTDPSPVDANVDFVLEWTSTNAVSAELDTVSVDVNGSTTKNIAADTMFELVVESTTGATSSCSVDVTVNTGGGGGSDPTGFVKFVKEVSNSNDTATQFAFDPSWTDANFVLVAGASTTVELDVDTYSVTELAQTGWSLIDTECVYEDSSTSTASNIQVLEDQTTICTFTNEEVVEETYLVFGYVWGDENENDIWDGEQEFFENEGQATGTDIEQPIEGWTVTASNGEVTYSTTTDEFGRYEFYLPSGNWIISETLQPNYAQTFPNSNGSHEVAVGLVATAEETSFFAVLRGFFIPTAHAQAAPTFGPFNFGIVAVAPTVTTTSTGGGGGGTPTPRCELFEGDVDGDEIRLTWETRNGRDLKIERDGVQIFSTSNATDVNGGSYVADINGASEFELTVYRSTRNDSCIIELDGGDDGAGEATPTPQVLGEQITAVPLGAADTGAGGATGSALPSAFTMLFLLASLATLRVTRVDA